MEGVIFIHNLRALGQGLLDGGVMVGTDRRRTYQSRGVYGNGSVTKASPSWCPRTFKLAPAEERSGGPDVAIPLNSEGGHASISRSPKELLLGSRAFRAPTAQQMINQGHLTPLPVIPKDGRGNARRPPVDLECLVQSQELEKEWGRERKA